MTLSKPHRIALCFAIVAACSPDNTTVPTSPLTAAKSSLVTPYEVSHSSIALQPGQSFQLVATKAANGKAVPEPSVAWSSADASIATVSLSGLVTAVGVGETTVSVTRGAHRVDVLVKVGCAIGVLAFGVTNGEITPDDCLFDATTGRRADFYSIIAAQGEVIGVITTGGITGRTGIRQTTADPRVGTIFGSRSVGTRYRVISNGEPLRFFVSGQDETVFGAYAVTRSSDTQTHSCGQLTFVVPGASFTTTLNPTNSCVYNVAFTNFPPALDRPLNAHRYWVRLEEIREYTIKIEGLSSTFDPGLTVFPNVVGGAPVIQSLPGGATFPTRSVTFTPPSPGFYLMEVAAGRFPNGPPNWVIESGTFSLSITP